MYRRSEQQPVHARELTSSLLRQSIRKYRGEPCCSASAAPSRAMPPSAAASAGAAARPPAHPTVENRLPAPATASSTEILQQMRRSRRRRRDGLMCTGDAAHRRRAMMTKRSALRSDPRAHRAHRRRRCSTHCVAGCEAIGGSQRRGLVPLRRPLARLPRIQTQVGRAS